MTPAEALAATIPMKPPVPRAPGIECRRHQGGMTLTRRWFRPKHYVLSLIVVGACAWIGSQWANAEGIPGYLVVATLFCVSFAYNVMSMFVNETSIVVTESRIDVTHGPLPSPFGWNRSVERAQVKSLSVEPRGAHFGIVCELEGGASVTLVAPLVSAEQARFVEYQLNQTWALASPAQEGQKPEEKSGGVGALGFVIPLLIGASLLLFFHLASAEVKGSFEGTEQGANWNLTPDDCTSGQRDGFSGVTLTQKGQTRSLRIINDPVKGKLLVVAVPGRLNQVIESANCKIFDLRAERTSTNVNDIWLVDGSAQVECESTEGVTVLRGEVTFEGCQ